MRHLWVLVLLGACAGNPQGCTSWQMFASDDVWWQWRLPLFGTNIPSVAGPDPVKTTDDGAGSQGVYAACFNHNSAEHIFDGRIVPTNVSATTEITTRFVWYPADGTAGNVRWCQETTAGSAGYDFDSNNSNSACVTSAASGTQGVAVETDISGPPFAVPNDTATQFHFWREAGDAADTYGADACIIGIQAYYKCDRSGLGALP